jgi:hypothetical protein
MIISKHSYNNTFDNFFQNYNPENETKPDNQSMIKVASGCISCPYFGNVSSDKCNSCVHAAGLVYSDGEQYIKCSYVSGTMKKEASSVQAIHWENGALPTIEHFNKIREDTKTKLEEELKYAAHNIGVQLAQNNLDEFVASVTKENMYGRALEKAAKNYVSKLNEKIMPADKRVHTGKLDDVFTIVSKSNKTVLPNISSLDKNDSQNCGYLGSAKNPNTIWNSEALTKAAQTPSSDEITKGLKTAKEQEKQSFKESYWKALEDRLSEKGLISNSKIHSLASSKADTFNGTIPQNAMGIFGENKEFSNLPNKTAGEMLSVENQKRADKKTESNKEAKPAKAQTLESNNWLFKGNV